MQGANRTTVGVTREFRLRPGNVIGALRYALTVLLLPVFALGILLTVLVPVKIRGVRLAGWATTATARIGLRLLRVRVVTDERDRIAGHGGFLFPNHVSFLDILVMLSFAPVRFLASAGVRTMPIIGTVAAAIGTQFVDRTNPESRQQSREALAASPPNPPIVIFPEGGIPLEKEIWPLRHGAFEIASETGRDAQIIGLEYDTDGARWASESLWRAWYRIQVQEAPVSVRVTCGPLFSVAQLSTESGVTSAAEAGRTYFAEVTGLPFGEPKPELGIAPTDPTPTTDRA